MKVLSINESFGNNIGDQAIYLGLKTLLNEKDIEVLSIPLSIPLSIHSGNKKKFNKNKRNFFENVKKIYLLSVTINIIRIFIFNVKRLKTTVLKIKESDFVVFGGGSLLINNRYSFPFSLFYLGFLCRLLNKPYGVAGVSTRVINEYLAIKLIKNFLSNSKFIYVRDSLSQSLCKKQFNVDSKVLPDFALCVKNKFTNSKNDIVFDVAINIMGPQAHGSFSDMEFVKKYRSSIVEFINNNKEKKIILYTTGEESDNNFMYDIISSIKNANVSFKEPSNIYDLTELYSVCDRIIATRLHSAIIAFSCKKDVSCFNWDVKVDGFFKTLGLSNQLINDFHINLDIKYGKIDEIDYEYFTSELSKK